MLTRAGGLICRTFPLSIYMENPETPSAPAPDPKVAEALAFLQAAEQSAATGDASRIAWTLQQYEQAISKLGALLSEGSDVARFLALAWVGRGNVQRTRGDQEGFNEALRSYDEGIKVVRAAEVDPALEAMRQNDLANIWTNRGVTLLAVPQAEALTEAVVVTAVRSLPEHEGPAGLLPARPHRLFAALARVVLAPDASDPLCVALVLQAVVRAGEGVALPREVD